VSNCVTGSEAQTTVDRHSQYRLNHPFHQLLQQQPTFTIDASIRIDLFEMNRLAAVARPQRDSHHATAAQRNPISLASAASGMPVMPTMSAPSAPDGRFPQRFPAAPWVAAYTPLFTIACPAAAPPLTSWRAVLRSRMREINMRHRLIGLRKGVLASQV